jgi:hypothetical protein
MKKIKLISIALVLMATSCTTQRITTTWKTDQQPIRAFDKVMVLGLIVDTDRSIQENMENHFVDDLRALGYNAVSSLKEFGPKAFDKMTEEAAIDKLKNSSIDAVITIVLLDKQRERSYVPSDIYHSPFGYYNNYFWGYRSTLYRRIYSPGYYVIDTQYFWESNLFDMSDQKLLYSAQTQSFDPINSESMGHRYGKMIVKDMIKQQILSDKITK